MAQVTKETKIGELLQLDKDVSPILFSIGMHWKTYVFALYLYQNGDIIRESNDILGDYNPVSKEAKEDVAIGIIQTFLQDQLSEEYADRFYTPELDKAMNKMFDEIIGSYDELIKKADWLTFAAADINGDDVVDGEDLTLLKKFVMGEIKVFD